MLVMTDKLQNFIDSQMKETSEEVSYVIHQQVAKFIEKDPDGDHATAIIERWFTAEKEPHEVGDRVRLKFASHVLKALTIRRYIRESKSMSYWALINLYQQGTHWQKQTCAGEITYRVSQASTEAEFKNWLKEMSELDTGADVDFLIKTPEQFPGLTA